MPEATTASLGAGSIVARPPEPHELEAFADCVERAFSAPLSPRRRALYLEAIDPTRSRAAFDGPTLVATSVGYSLELTVPGAVAVPTFLLEDFTVLATHRRRGIGSALMAWHLEAAYERGELAVVLEASEGGIYTRFGFGVATLGADYRIARSRAALHPEREAPKGSVLLLRADEAIEALPLVFDAARRLRVGEISREQVTWEELVEDPTPLERATHARVVHQSAGLIDGYAVYRVVISPDGSRDVVVEELCSITDAAYRALFAYLLDIDLTSGCSLSDRPLDEPLRHLLTDPRALETVRVRDRAWLRVVDARALLAARHYRGSGEIVLELVDAHCPWNAGRIALVIDERGRAQVETTTSMPEIRLDAAVLGTVILGGTPLGALCRAGRAEECASGSAARFDRVAGCDPLPFCDSL